MSDRFVGGENTVRRASREGAQKRDGRGKECLHAVRERGVLEKLPFGSNQQVSFPSPFTVPHWALWQFSGQNSGGGEEAVRGPVLRARPCKQLVLWHSEHFLEKLHSKIQEHPN